MKRRLHNERPDLPRTVTALQHYLFMLGNEKRGLNGGCLGPRARRASAGGYYGWNARGVGKGTQRLETLTLSTVRLKIAMGTNHSSHWAVGSID